MIMKMKSLKFNQKKLKKKEMKMENKYLIFLIISTTPKMKP